MALHRTWIALAAALAGAGIASRAEASPCTTSIRVVGDSVAWQRAVEVVQGELAARSDIERCVDIVVEVDADHRHAAVSVVLEGRRAMRTVADPGDLRSTLLSLLLEPTPPAPATDAAAEPRPEIDVSAPPTAPFRPAAALPPARPDPRPLVAAAAAPAVSAVETAVDVGLAMGALWTGQGTDTSVAAFVREQRGAWSFSIHGRLAVPSLSGSQSVAAPGSGAPAGSMQDASAMTWREAGAELGHRFELRSVAVTASVGPSLVALQQADAAARRATVMRGVGRVRVESASMRHVGVFLSVDASAELGQLDATADRPLLPTWSVGASFGGELRVWP